MKKIFIFFLLYITLFSKTVFSEIITVRGYGIVNLSEKYSPVQQKDLGLKASKTVALENITLLKGSKLIIKNNGYELLVQGKIPKYNNVRYKKISPLYYECLIEINNDKFVKNKKIQKISFDIIYNEDLDLSNEEEVKKYNNYMNLNILQKFGDEIIKKENLENEKEIVFDYLFIDKKLGQKTVHVNIFYNVVR